MSDQKDKRAAFVGLATKRTQNVLHQIDVLSKLANSSNYEYSSSDIEAIDAALQAAVTELKATFTKGLEGGHGPKKPTFALGD